VGNFKIKYKNLKKAAILIVLLPFSVYAQKQGNQWCFGAGAGIDWNDSINPTFFTSASSYRGSCASIADANGALLFYCANTRADGLICENILFNHVYNKNHEIMEDGACLPGSGWYNEHTIFPFPNNDSLYYVFSVDDNSSISYNLVDMNANEGLGKVIERDHQLVVGDPYGALVYFAWSITATKHGNGRDWWVIAKSAGQYVQSDSLPSIYYIFLVTPDGVTTTIRPAEFSTETNINQLLFNHQGDKFYSIDFFGPLQEYNFNRCTGELLLNRTIDDTTYFIQGDSVYFPAYIASEISPNGRFLYTSSLINDCLYWKSYLLQFDLWAENPLESIDTIAISSPIIDGFDDYRSSGALRLAPDGKIYFSRGLHSCTYEDIIPYPDTLYTTSNSNLGVINNPDSLGNACNFTEYSFYLGGNRTYFGLPNNPNYNLEPLPECDTLSTSIKPQKQFLKKNFNIFPNPCYNNCILEYKPAKEKGSIAIATSTGKIVFTEKNIPVSLLQHGYEVNTSAFVKGVYTVILLTGKEVVTKKLIKL
jgi:Secretion system C-terminal sorting domain